MHRLYTLLKIYSLLTTFCICLITGCAYSPSDNAFEYTVNLSAVENDSIFITLKIHVNEGDESLQFLAPPVYSDNPWLEQKSAGFHDLKVTGQSGNNITVSLDSVTVGLHKCLRISFPCNDTIISVRYTITFDYVDTIYGPFPFLENNRGYWQGGHIFLLPYTTNDLADIWRTPYNFSVTYNTATGQTLHGDPLPTVFFSNVYELMFSTNALNADVLALGKGGRQRFRFVTLAESNQIDPLLLNEAVRSCQILLEDITSIFEPITATPLSVIFGINNAGGLEGMYAFSIINPFENDIKGWFPMILAHETIHAWIGLRVGDYEDPWWKEGTTSYLGYLFALRNNLCSDYFITNKLLADLSGDPSVHKYALADPEVRKRIYADVDNCESLVYDKGAQVTMLFDRKIREESGECTSIDEILGDFAEEYNGRAFYRQEYIAFIKEKSGVDISDIVSQYVITTGVIPDSVLQENCNALIAMGAFGDTTVPVGTAIIDEPFTPRRW